MHLVQGLSTARIIRPGIRRMLTAALRAFIRVEVGAGNTGRKKLSGIAGQKIIAISTITITFQVEKVLKDIFFLKCQDKTVNKPLEQTYERTRLAK
jgi:hypothetical protein